MEKNQVSLSIGDIVSNGVSIGMKNFVNLLLASILWVVTIWIPYLNLGTTIAMIDIVARLARGEEISPTGIFDAKYRARIGEFFLFLAFYVAGLVSSYIFLATPIVQTAWSLAPFLFVDKDRDPLESLKESNKLTYGHKMTIFLAMIVIYVAYIVVYLIAAATGEMIIMLLALIVGLLTIPIYAGATSYVYNRLTGDGVAAS